MEKIRSSSNPRKDRKRKRKFYGNRFTKPTDHEQNGVETSNEPNEKQGMSSSFRKLDESINSSCDSSIDRNVISNYSKPTSSSATKQNSPQSDERKTGFRMFRLECLIEFLQNFPCPSCFSSKEVGENYFVTEKLTGISSLLTLTCLSCKANVSFSNDENVNLRFQTAMFGIGCHESKGQRFLTAMDMPQPVSSVRASVFRDRILTATKTVAQECMQKAAAELKDADGDNVTVSCDGSWQRRGFVSKNGVATCLSVSKKIPAKVIDTETLSNYCDSCAKMKCKKLTAEKKREWEENHKKLCKKNHDGTAGSMEPVGLKTIFKRSEEQYGLKYTNYLGDGDSKSFKFVSEANPPIYDHRIEKLECCGHVQKRMGKRLLDKVNECRGKVYTVGNKKVKGIGGAGRLTKVAIKRIQGHYGGAIRKNVNDLEKMKKAIWAIWFHRKGEHSECGSWCDGSNKNKLPEFVLEEIKPVFEDLSSDNLLNKCLHGGTQNANESFHNLIWDRCPKTTFVGRDRLQIAVYDGTIVFNGGEMQRCAVFKELGLKIGYHQKAGCRKLDSNRVKSAEKQILKGNKRKRAEKTVVSAQEENGEEDYQAGAF